ncbi:MAG: hypothetical protein B7Z08_06310 [Sphingomonadales bacterium 32-68-7]|nr:MAG: hypothetical protein B7Z33_12160 [Sphingomonadales bacterium 12-68-11]OYX09144.1 MAG: hypothetical protein B7Z08_06310 [Sphingomonadales bacterium 32-68-7]
MKSIAIVYDKFLVQGGGERVCEMLLEAFPDASIYALNARPRAFWEARLGRPVVSPVLGWLFASRALVTALYPLAALLMATLRIKADVVIAYSSTCGKYAHWDSSQSILYSNYPNRGLYQPEKVIASRFLRAVLAPIMALMRPIERRQIARYQRTYSISEASRRAMLDFAGVDSAVLMPPFNEQGIEAARTIAPPSPAAEDYFVLVSRLEPEKELDYVIEAFRGSPHRLKLIGKGSLLETLRRASPSNVEVLGFIPDDVLAHELAGARALIFPSDIEYSLVPLEATFLGTPVISYAAPALREILLDVATHGRAGNAIFFTERSAPALAEAVARFDSIDWDAEAVRASAARFGRAAFIDRVQGIVNGLDDTGA